MSASTPATSGPHRPDGTPYEVVKPESEWRSELDPAAYQVLRLGGTERPFSGEYEHDTTPGVYCCRACGARLFTSDTKFDARCGWPAFYQPDAGDAVVLLADRSGGMVRTEVRCAACGSHLGHVFTGEGFPTPTDERYCINSVCLQLHPGDAPAGTTSEGNINRLNDDIE